MPDKRDFDFAGRDAATRIAAVSQARDVWVYRLISRGTQALLRLRHKKYLASLSHRQLRDAGINLTLAGRGRASAARIDPNHEALR